MPPPDIPLTKATKVILTGSAISMSVLALIIRMAGIDIVKYCNWGGAIGVGEWKPVEGVRATFSGVCLK